MDAPYKFEKVDFFTIDSPLLKFSENIASQSGEDGIIEKIFQLITPSYSYCVEFGAWDGKYLSNSYNLIQNKKWGGAFIEGNSEKFKELVTNHGENSKLKLVNKFIDFSGPNSLDQILHEIETPLDFDFLSIDIDGTDYFIWESLNNFRPKVVVIEFNPTVPNDIIFVQPKNSALNQGCSLLSLILLGKNKGYELVCCTGWNAFFVCKEYFDKFELKSNSIWHMYKPIQDGRIWHGFDSHVYVYGMTKFLWNPTNFTNEDFQILPESLRKFGDSQR
jgi:hypothetical protein